MLLCSAQGAWYAEFVFLYYKIAMASLSVLLGSSARAAVCMGLMALLTAAMLAFVLIVKPFKDDRSILSASTEMMTSADKMQASAFAATIVACTVGFVCALIPDRGAGLNALLTVLTALIGVMPIAFGLYLDPPCETDGAQEEQEEEDQEQQQQGGHGKQGQSAQGKPVFEAETPPEAGNVETENPAAVTQTN